MPETRRVYLKSREYFIGVEPANPGVVYADRTTVGGWELVELTKLNHEEYAILFVEAGVQFSQQPDGTYQTRPRGHIQSWERLRGGRLPSGVEILGSFVVVPA